MSNGPVILFKSPPEDAHLSSDPYYISLSTRGFGPIGIIPVIEHTFVNILQLSEDIALGPQSRYGGVIMTSGRAAEAWKIAAEEVIRNESSQESCSWSTTPFYVVGARTASALSNTLPNVQQLLPSPSLILGATHSGNAEKLSQFILSDYKDRAISLPLLYLTGDKNRDTIPRTLKEHSIPLKELKVYQTSPRSGESIQQDIVSFKESISTMDVPAPTWIGFFAPSSADAALPHVQQYFDLPGAENPHTPSSTLIQSRVAAIGRTTSSYLSATHPQKFRVDVTSPSPDAESLAQAILQYASNNYL